MRTIDADALKKCAIPCQIHNGALTELCVPMYQIDNAPTVEIQMARMVNGILIPIRVPGKWLFKEITEDNRVYGQCSVCKQRKRVDNFCGNCGADMRKGGAEE